MAHNVQPIVAKLYWPNTEIHDYSTQGSTIFWAFKMHVLIEKKNQRHVQNTINQTPVRMVFG